MSWILAAFNAPEHICETARGLVNQTPSSLFQISDHRRFIASGGIPETCHHPTSTDSQLGWTSVGLGLAFNKHRYQSLTTEDWHQHLKLSPPDLPSNGHFAALTWKGSQLDAFTDPLGIRTLYFTKIEKGLLLSTRLDWLAQLSGSQSIDFNIFGSHWLAFNQLSQQAPLLGINRLSAGGHLSLTQDGIHIERNPWHPSQTTTNPIIFNETLRAFMRPALPDNLSLSLGLSGGLDSRMLLALGRDSQVRHLHTFGPSEKADVAIAKEIATCFEIPHSVIDEPMPTADQCLVLLQNQVAHTQGVSAASSVLGLRYYSLLRDRKYAVIDGGFGEIARRQFLKRLLWRGSAPLKQALINGGNFDEILPMIAFPRPQIFTEEINTKMKAGVVEHFEKIWNQMPARNEFGLENTFDLFSIHTRLPNFFGYEQNRLDGAVLSYMPFAQPDFLDIVFDLKLQARRGGRHFRKTIREQAPLLARSPLVKGAYTYPFRLSSTGAFIWTKAKSKIKPAPASTLQYQFLDALQPFVKDTLLSKEVTSFAPYDLKEIRQMVNGYYAGEKGYANAVDWWLTFEVWRQEISKKAV